MSKREMDLNTSGMEEEEEEEEEPPSLMGNLRTSLKWDLGKKQLHLGDRNPPECVSFNIGCAESVSMWHRAHGSIASASHCQAM